MLAGKVGELLRLHKQQQQQKDINDDCGKYRIGMGLDHYHFLPLFCIISSAICLTVRCCYYVAVPPAASCPCDFEIGAYYYSKLLVAEVFRKANRSSEAALTLLVT